MNCGQVQRVKLTSVFNKVRPTISDRPGRVRVWIESAIPGPARTENGALSMVGEESALAKEKQCDDAVAC